MRRLLKLLRLLLLFLQQLADFIVRQCFTFALLIVDNEAALPANTLNFSCHNTGKHAETVEHFPHMAPDERSGRYYLWNTAA